MATTTSVAALNRRTFARTPVPMCLHLSAENRPTAYPSVLEDLALRGARMRCSIDAEVGSRMNLTFEFENGTFSIPCCVCWTQPSLHGQYRLGVRFGACTGDALQGLIQLLSLYRSSPSNPVMGRWSQREGVA